MDRTAHWEGVYARKDAGEVSWFQAVPARSLAWIAEVAPDRGTPILDVGAGASRLVDHLLERGYRSVAVLDLSANALEQVRRRLGERAEAVEWFTGDLLDFVSPHPFDVWHDRAVLHFLREPAQQARYAEVLRGTLRPGGHALIATFAVGGPTRCSGLDTVQYDCARLSALLGPGFACVRDEQENHQTPGGGEQRFQYCLFRRDS
jgi:SAM-dependent methyltransferase